MTRRLGWIVLTSPVWVWGRTTRRDGITLLMWSVPMRWRGRFYLALARWFMDRWHPQTKGAR